MRFAFVDLFILIDAFRLASSHFLHRDLAPPVDDEQKN